MLRLLTYSPAETVDDGCCSAGLRETCHQDEPLPPLPRATGSSETRAWAVRPAATQTPRARAQSRAWKCGTGCSHSDRPNTASNTGWTQMKVGTDGGSGGRSNTQYEGKRGIQHSALPKWGYIRRRKRGLVDKCFSSTHTYLLPTTENQWFQDHIKITLKIPIS